MTVAQDMKTTRISEKYRQALSRLDAAAAHRSITLDCRRMPEWFDEWIHGDETQVEARKRMFYGVHACRACPFVDSLCLTALHAADHKAHEVRGVIAGYVVGHNPWKSDNN